MSYERARQVLSTLPDAKGFVDAVATLIDKHCRVMPIAPVILAWMEVIEELYQQNVIRVIPLEPSPGTIEHARWRDAVNALCVAPDISQMAATVAQCIQEFTKLLPPFAKVAYEDLKDSDIEAISVPLGEVADVHKLVDSITFTLIVAPDPILFPSLRARFGENCFRISGKVRSSEDLIVPGKYKGNTPLEFLTNTPLLRLFSVRVPMPIPQQSRFEHCWIVAGSGHGKTQTLQYLIAKDLDLVAEGKASVIVIDSQSDIIRAIAGLKDFGFGGRLEGKLCLIDPHDIEYPVSLNLFDVNLERINKYSALDRERLINGILELYDFVLGSLLSAELTSKQAVVFRFMMRAMLVIPDATIQTLLSLVSPGGYDKFKVHLDRLPDPAGAFFATEFNSPQFRETKQQIIRRLWGILENGVFERMFSHPRNKLDLFGEMNAGKVILVNTAKDLLKQEGTQILGRFFIAMIAQAAQERATLKHRLPCFVYVDEAAEYFDEKVALILEQARKYNVGLTLAHQYLGQLPPKLHESFSANTSIKMAGGVSDKDARALASMMRTSTEFIEGQGKGSFAVSIRNYTESAISMRFPFGHVEAMGRLSALEAERLKTNMREHYSVPVSEVQHSISSHTSAEHTSTNQGTIGTDTSKDWK